MESRIILILHPCYIVQVLNRRRIKRKGKTLRKHRLDLLDRVKSVMLSGKLVDFVHPKEIDPYWTKLYYIHEYFTYLKFALKYEILKAIDKNQFQYAESLINDYHLVEMLHKKVLNYMKNFAYVIMNIVMKNRFFGWFSYLHEFLTTFYISYMRSITSLFFDTERSRASVYLYQLFWLTGVGITKKIMKTASTEKIVEEYHYSGRGSRLFSKEVSFDDYIIDIEASNDSDEIEDEQVTFVRDDTYESELIYEHDITSESNEELIRETCSLLLKEVFPYISIEDLSVLSQKDINVIARHIRELLNKQEIKLSQKLIDNLKLLGYM